MSLSFEAANAIGLPVAVGLGLVYGTGPCLMICLPYLGPIFLNTDGGIRNAWRILLPVALGRLTVYGSFGAISGWWAQRYVDGVETWVGHLITGAAALLIGLALLSRRTHCHSHTRASCAHQPSGEKAQTQRISFYSSPPAPEFWINRPVMPTGLYLAGVSMALTPCAPMSIVLFSAATSGSPCWGLSLGLGFGLGAVLAPSLVYGLGFAYFAGQLRAHLGKWQSRLEILSAVLFIVLGLNHILKAG